MDENAKEKAKRNLYDGYFVPVPKVKGYDNGDIRYSFGIVWGNLTQKPRVKDVTWPTKENKEQRLVLHPVFRSGGILFKCMVSDKNPWFDVIRELEKGERCLLTGVFVEKDYVDKRGDERTERLFYVGFCVPLQAVTNPSAWLKRIERGADPVFSAAAFDDYGAGPVVQAPAKAKKPPQTVKRPPQKKKYEPPKPQTPPKQYNAYDPGYVSGNNGKGGKPGWQK